MAKTNIVTEDFTITLKYRMSIDIDTGEILSTELISKDTTNKPRKKEDKEVVEESKPLLTLEDNKYRLNTSALKLMGITSGDKLDIKYEKFGQVMRPVIGTDESFGTKSGNQLTKSNTVAYRGVKHSELSKYGTEFILEPHNTKSDLFILMSEIEQKVPQGDENVNLEDTSFNLEEFLEDTDTQVTEINSDFFNFNL